MTVVDVDVVVIGNGMVGHRFIEAVVGDRSAGSAGLRVVVSVVVIGEESRKAYDRVHLSSLFDGVTESELTMTSDEIDASDAVEYVLGDPVVTLDTGERLVTTASGRVFRYVSCVLATGSSPFVPPIPGTHAAGSFVYRTIDDIDAMRAWSTRCTRGVVVGGGLLGLEAANALRLLGLEVTVVEFAQRLMAVQLDEGGGRALRRRIEDLGLVVRTGAGVTGVEVGDDGAVFAVTFGENDSIDTDMVVFAAGVRPRDQLARQFGLEVGERGGVVIDDACRTSAAGVFAIGEVACHRSRVYGLVAPGYEMAEAAADQILGGQQLFEGADTSTRLKLLGVDVACVGNPHAVGEDVIVADPATGTWQRVILGDQQEVLGAVLVGDVAPFNTLVQRLRSATPSPDVLDVLRPTAGATSDPLADHAGVCSCHNVTCGSIRAAVSEGFEDVAGVKKCTKAGTGCGSCVPTLQLLIDEHLAASGREVVKRLCRHFAMTRPELYEVAKVTGIRTFTELIARHGSGHGCEICKPVAASIFASLGSGYILDGEQASLQDSNDHFLANLQRDGTYSVVPRVPGGEITPEQLIAIGEVAREFDLYTKITGGQRIDLFGVRVEQLPAVWARLVAAGMESGHAYGKALRTVKSCVGTAWCRYGVQDSTAMAIALENRYRGLRAPHKIKLAVSGCARECAEAQSKDVGVIATEQGWNLYVGGNGGMRPAHAVLLAEDLDDDALIRAIDRYLMWYVRTAERLERTATWQRKLPGGIDFVRRVVIDDVLAIGAELDAEMAAHIATYECEWAATLANPERLARFASFVNTPEPDPTITHVTIRGQRMPDLEGARP
jgi:nitrite reductase (NADH) large subunit